MLKGHGGNIYDLAQSLSCAPFEVIDMSSNVNPFGPPPGLENFLKENLNVITALPEVDAKRIVYSFAQQNEIDPETVLAGNGSTQFIYAIPQALKTRRALIIGPTYADYADACSMYHVHCEHFITKESQGFKPDINEINNQVKDFDTVFICNPNNPTGTLIPAAELKTLCRSHPNILFVIDESYLPFVNTSCEESMLRVSMPNVIILNSMSKIFRISGLRIGFIIASKKIIETLIRYLLPWSVNALAQIAVRYLIENKGEVNAFIEQTQKLMETERNRFADKLKNASNIKLFQSTTTFILAKLSNRYTADTVCRQLSHEKILIRNCSNFKGLTNRFIRFKSL